MPGREEQNRLLLKTMRQFGYPEEKLELEYLHGFPHCGYLGEAGYLDRIAAFLKSGY